VALAIVRGDLGCAEMQQVRFNDVRLIMVQPTVAAVDPMLTIRPLSRALLPGRTLRVRRKRQFGQPESDQKWLYQASAISP
jgi:hypothetical protein